MNYVITGHKGLIGESLKARLDQKHKCVGAFDQREGFNINSLNGLELNPETQKTDILFHLAAQCKINQAIENPELPHLNNADGTHAVLEFCRKNKIPKIVNFSSSRVLSKERNPYVASKIYGEELVKSYAECYGIEYITVRPSTVYGPHKDITSRLMTNWCKSALNDGELVIFGDKDKTLDFTYISDFVDGIELLINNWDNTKNDSYNISGNEEVKLFELAEIIIDNTGGGKLVYQDPEIAQPQKVNVDTSKMIDLGFKPKVNIWEGLTRTLNFFKGERDWNKYSERVKQRLSK